jgi:hypothetical protein
MPCHDERKEKSTLLLDIEDAQKRETPVEQSDRIRHEQSLMIHPQTRDEDRAGRVGAPHDRHGCEGVSDRVIDSHCHADTAEADHGQETVAEDGGCAVRVDPRVGHEVEKEVDCRGTEEADAVDV